jgi:hypothetical protein
MSTSDRDLNNVVDRDFHDEEEDGDDDDEFVPGSEEEEADDDHDEGDNNSHLDVLNGKISVDSQGKLVLEGEGYHLQSTEAFEPSKNHSSLLLVGTWQLPGANPKLKAPPRRIQLSLASAVNMGKRTGSEDEINDGNDGQTFDIQGTEEATTANSDETLQLFGQVVIGTKNPRAFSCRWRRVAVNKTAIVQSPQAAAAPKKNNNNKDNDDDEDCEDADDDVDFDELAALHEEARMSVDAVINKRYREGPAERKEEGSPANKRAKGETDDEEDIEF